ncbi:MAG: hypothetical protein ACYC1G_02705 [Thiobacillus sp.]
MSAYHFTTFNPVSGEVPYHPFSLLPAIAWRARALLESRTAKQIDAAAQGIECAIDEYFSTVKGTEIERLRRETVALDEAGLGPEWPINDYDDLDIPTANNTSEVDALKTCIDNWDKDFSDEKPPVLFAVLALSLLAEALNWLSCNSAHKVLDGMDAALDALTLGTGLKAIKTNTNLSIAGGCALKAMDAICHAEHLRHMERLEEKYATKLKANDLAEAKHGEERSRRNKDLNDARHRKRNEAVEKAIREWEKDPSKYPSAEKAGLHLADWLTPQGFEYEPRTVTGWIRTHAKKIGVRFR